MNTAIASGVLLNTITELFLGTSAHKTTEIIETRTSEQV